MRFKVGESPMILSASRRTDIPAYYSDWFCKRVRAGYLCVRNPMNAHQVSRVSLDPAVVDCIVFWTKNPAPMLERLEELAAYQYYFQVTLTGYGRDVEGNVPDKHEVLLPAFKQLAAAIGPERVIWRYDPILFNERYTPEYHLRAVRSIAQELEGRTEKCVISFVDTYAKNRKNMERLHARELPQAELEEFAGRLASITREHGMVTASCAEKIDLAACGIEHNACIDGALIERLLGCRLAVKKDPSQRIECGCMASVEVGAYNTCRHACTYCYANYSADAVARSCAAYDPDSPILCGTIAPDDKVTDRKMVSLIERQQPLGI